MTKILIVEDEPNMVAGLRDNFEFEGYEVISAPDGVAGLERAVSQTPDLVILDVMMPRMSGLEVCKQLKAKRPGIPIIMLTARGQEVDKVVGLELGADDYVTKPFSIREFLARVKAVLRRAKPAAQDQERRTFGDVEVNFKTCQVLRKGKPLEFSAKEFDLLEVLRGSFRRGTQSRSAPRRGLGLRQLSDDPHGGRAYCPPPAKTRTQTRRTAFDSDHPWCRLQVCRLTVLERVVKRARDQRNHLRRCGDSTRPRHPPGASHRIGST